MNGGVQVTTKSTNMGSMSVNTVKSGIAGSVNVNNASRSGFNVPFDKKSERANRAVQLDDLEDGRIEHVLLWVGYVDADIMHSGPGLGAIPPEFVLLPATWQKKISKDLRKDAVGQLYHLLSRSFLSTPDGRNKIDENKIFAKLGSGKSMSDERSVSSISRKASVAKLLG